MEVSIELIQSSPFQPRLRFDIEDLKQEITRDGLLSPLLVRKLDEYYELIDGERRLRALKEMGWKTVPVEIRELDDRRARLSIYKLNTVRETYSVEERTRYFKRLHDSGMNFYQIGRELHIDDNWVLAHINIFRFPEDIQQAVWDGTLSIKHIQTIEPIIGANIEDAIKVAREIVLRKLSVREAEQLVKPRREAIEKARVEAAKQAIGVATPISVKLEEPRDLERAAKALLDEAKKKREEVLTPEEKAEIERKHEEKKWRAEQARKALEEKVRAKVEQEVKAKAAEELLKEPEVLRELVTRPDIRQYLEEVKKPEAPPKIERIELPEEPLPVQLYHKRLWNVERLDREYDFYTVGYSETDLEHFIELLRRAGVRTLLDVRHEPVSIYKPEFNLESLARAVRSNGLNYFHERDLGVPREVRTKLAETGDWDAFFKWYDENVIPRLGNDVDLEKYEKPIAFMCVELDPTKCHRHRIALALEKKGLKGFDL